ncbi:hypothetical protein RDABS01_010998 [Bienertia sinuspersici]
MDLLAEMRNLSIPCVFLNNLIFQLFNYFILPSATLAKLVKIYMCQCNNKMLFVTSSFVGWLSGHILFMKGAGLKLKETPEMKETKEQTDVEIEKTSETEETKQQEEGFIEENPSPHLFQKEWRIWTKSIKRKRSE